MGLDALQTANKQRARATAVKVFDKCLSREEVERAYVREYIASDKSARVFVSVLDKFGMYFVLNERNGGKPLSRNTCMQYYRQVKLWVLETFPVHRVALDARLLKMGRTMNSSCLKREGGGMVKKAFRCTKRDLKRMMLYLYASMASDYHDACLLALPWYMFGRASDLMRLHKQNVPIDAGGVFFVRFIRVETSGEQWLSLYPDSDYATDPLLALACALATQASPSVEFVASLPPVSSEAQLSFVDEGPLAEVLEAPVESALAPPLQTAVIVSAVPVAIYSHVNRLLERIVGPAGVVEQLTSHSFRRGGAQYANACADLPDRWIFDRGAWNVTTTNKAFNYVFNTHKEDHKVAKVLSGWRPSDHVLPRDVDGADSGTRERIAAVKARLFAACSHMETSRYCISVRVHASLVVALLLHYPRL